MTRHIMSLIVEDKPGSLTRVAGLFARRGYNIESLAVGETEVEGGSRITIVVEVEDLPLEQVTKQLNKLINVLKIVEQQPEKAMLREHMLIKVKTEHYNRTAILATVEMFRAKVIDVSLESVVIEITGEPSKCQALLKVLEPYGIKELVQSGVIAIGRGSKSITEKVLK